VILGAIREIFGNGTFYKMPVFGPTFEPFAFMVTAPGAFVCLGLMLCIMNLLGRK
jgi:electron transport complex protein RnfE